jgi:uncharacterized iron-regulated protein
MQAKDIRSFARGCAMLAAYLFSTGVGAQVLPAYTLFDGQGKKLSHERFLRIVAAGDIILFGEEHDDPIAHWLQLVVAKDLSARGPLVLGAEMIEADDQATLDRYLRGEIDEAAFDTLARLWKNHDTDYAPLVDLAKEKGLPFVATNVPRRFARAVSKGGFTALDTLTDAQRAWVAPMPIAFDPDLPGYKRMLAMMEDHGTPAMVQAQALKDATMAYFITQHVIPGARFLHFNGSFHSDFHEGIGWYLQRAVPQLKVVTIATVLQKDLTHLETEFRGQADIIICVTEEMTRTH